MGEGVRVGVGVVRYYIHYSHVTQLHAHTHTHPQTQTHSLGFTSNLECPDGSKAYLN